MSERRGPIGLSEEQAELLDSATRYCGDKSPVDMVRQLIDDELGHDPAVFAEMAELGWLGIAIPEAYGGAGLELAEVVPVVEQMGRHLMAGPFVSTTLAAQLLLAAGTDAQKSEVLPQLASGTPATIALAEPNADFDPMSAECMAQRDGGELVLAGTKCLVLDVHVARFAIVSLRLDDAPALVLLDGEAIAAASHERETIVDETKRSFRLGLDGVRVPDSALLDTSNVASALERIELAGALLGSAEMCGAGVSCVAYTVSYLNERKQFGRPIGAYQALKHTTVDAHLRIEQARSHVYAAAHTFEKGSDGEIATRMAKASTGPALAFAADRAIQFHGGYGFTYECDAQLYRRNALFGEARFGDAVYHRRKLADLIL
ncbi:MAG: acyl-CoA dehydrogenase family protein [Myxococcota bacterium]|jgi:alkylation response protein AidB-like acyl-CoA dehydrogenase|nr:acyl-CoA dehydrogenase family protein [Myxococcota bacterium]